MINMEKFLPTDLRRRAGDYDFWGYFPLSGAKKK